jgi:hypothetical protein
MERGMPLGDGRRGPLDGLPVADVADLGLPAELGRQRLEAVAPAGEEDAEPPLACERARDRLADAAGGARDDGHAPSVRFGHRVTVQRPGQAGGRPRRAPG